MNVQFTIGLSSAPFRAVAESARRTRMEFGSFEKSKHRDMACVAFLAVENEALKAAQLLEEKELFGE